MCLLRALIDMFSTESMEPLLSIKMDVGVVELAPSKAIKIFERQIASLVAEQLEMFSASHEKRSTMLCFL